MLGRGAFGKVNLAMHKLVRKLVAIKSALAVVMVVNAEYIYYTLPPMFIRKGTMLNLPTPSVPAKPKNRIN